MSKKLTTEEFVKKANKVHNNKYSYEKSVYDGNRNTVIITCPIHGDFEQLASNHLAGYGCKKCANEKATKRSITTFEEFVERAYDVHGPKYLYYKNSYINANHKTIIVCPEHGKFQQQAQAHLQGQGCPICGEQMAIKTLRKKKTLEEFIEAAKKTHGDKYDYSKVIYNGYNNNVVIICKKHGEFEQTPHNHIGGSGCPKCKRSVLEEKTANVLDKEIIRYEDHVNKKRFSWLKNQHLDFYLPDYNVAIECQGIQHYEPIDFAGKGEVWAKRRLYTIKSLDKVKRDRCKDNFVFLEYIKYDEDVEERVKEIIHKHNVRIQKDGKQTVKELSNKALEASS